MYARTSFDSFRTFSFMRFTIPVLQVSLHHSSTCKLPEKAVMVHCAVNCIGPKILSRVALNFLFLALQGISPVASIPRRSQKRFAWLFSFSPIDDIDCVRKPHIKLARFMWGLLSATFAQRLNIVFCCSSPTFFSLQAMYSRWHSAS